MQTLVRFLTAALLGLLEGITEWLPISSTGHLILLEQVVPLEVSQSFREVFQVVIQLGAILAVPCLYPKRLVPLGPRQARRQVFLLWGQVALAVVPSAAVGLLLDDRLQPLFRPDTVAWMLVVYGIAFLAVEAALARGKLSRKRVISFPVALGIGLFQCLSLIPGTSRSGATILGALLLGVSREEGANFSFFLAIPTMAGAGLLKLIKFFLRGGSFSILECLLLLTGCLTAFLVSLLVIRGLTDFLKGRSFVPFAWYRIALGTVLLLLK